MEIQPLHIFLLLCCALAGCSESQSSIHVRICGDLLVPAELDAVRISILDEDRTEVIAVLDDLVPAGDRTDALPPDAGPAEPTDGRTVQRRVTLDAGRGLGWVVVQGLRDGVDVIRAEARGRDGDQVAVGLFRACLGVRCPKGRSCVHGVCELAPQGGNLCEESPP